MTDLAIVDSPVLRKARGAFFTPPAISEFIVNWAVRDRSDRIVEPSVGDASFLLPAVRRLAEMSRSVGELNAPTVFGVEIHPASAEIASQRIRAVGGRPEIRVNDFFDVVPDPTYNAVIGNPPFIRYQDFSGESRAKARAAALSAGVPISGLASSWAAFVVHSTSFLVHGGRLGFVLPAELLSVNYAGPVRKFLFDNFRSVDVVLFTERVFPEAEADVVLLLADGFGEGPTDHARILQSQNASTLDDLTQPLRWTPLDPTAKWTPSLLERETLGLFDGLMRDGWFTPLRTWGRTTLGAVSGNNAYFSLSQTQVDVLGLDHSDLVPLSRPGSTHLRNLSYGKTEWVTHQREGSRVWLFRPGVTPSRSALQYIKSGEGDGVNQAFKCRVREPWWQVPLSRKADLFLTYMNADSVRVSANTAGVHHLNSVHGVNLEPDVRRLGRSLLAMGSLSSMTLLGAELMGRAYGGGMLKVEPREADLLPMPSADLLDRAAPRLRQIRREVSWLLAHGDLMGASTAVDRVLFEQIPGVGSETSAAILRESRSKYVARRVARSNFRLAPVTSTQ